MSALPVLTSPLLDLPGVRHAFFTRHGGVSEGLYASLNLGPGSRDDPERVRENRRRAAEVIGLAPERLLTAYQVHSPDVVTVEAPWPGRAPEADALVTTTPGLACGALAADCAPVLMVDPQARVIGAAHAGWKGALAGVVGNAVARMTELGASPDRIAAVVGPCIGPASYEVGPEFRERFAAADPDNAGFFAPGRTTGKWMFDLPAFVLERLRRAGVTRREWIGRDVLAEPEVFYSNRRAYLSQEDDYGRLLSAVMLTE